MFNTASSYSEAIRAEQKQAKGTLHLQNHTAAKEEADDLKTKLPQPHQVCMEQTSERGASSQLTTISVSEKRVNEVEHGSLMPIVLSSSGGWGPSATMAFKRLASLLYPKLNQPYSRTLTFIRCKVAFSLLDSVIMCLRRARSSFHRPTHDTSMQDQPADLVMSEGWLFD